MNLETATQLLIHYRYLLLFPLAAFEGPIIAFVVGILTAAGYFNPFIAYTILLFGDIIPDSIYYFICRHGERKTFVARYGAKVGITEERFDIIKKLWHRHGFKTMFISKLAYGLSTPFLVAAGFAGITARKFYEYVLPVTIIQYAILMALGFYFGNSYVLITKYIENAQLIIAAAFIILLIGYYIFAYYLKTRILANKKENNII